MAKNSSITLSKTDYLLYRECKKNTWLKIHKPNIYHQHELSAFEKMIMEAGNEVDLAARDLFANGVIVEGRDENAQKFTQEHIQKKHPILFQAVFYNGGFLAAVDILEFHPETDSYWIYEVKSTNEIDDKTHYYDLAFQLNLLRKSGIKVDKVHLVHLNKEYIRNGELNMAGLFQIKETTEIVESLCEEVSIEMENALEYLSQNNLPKGNCICIYKGRSKHCTCFSVLNPEIPEYSIHDIARIGSSKKKLETLVDSKIFNIHEIPVHIELSRIQQNQVDAHKLGKIIVNNGKIAEELAKLVFPLYFIDYETLPAAMPRFDGYSPYQQIPFQYSLFVLESPTSTPIRLEFLHTDLDDPSLHFAKSLQQHIGRAGTLIVWNKTFECGRNSEIAERFPEVKPFMESLNSRTYDLMNIFKDQHYVHKDFKGSYSIKKVLPVFSSTLTYKDLSIQDGGSAAEMWNKIMINNVSNEEKDKIIQDLKVYCGLDAEAMHSIWYELCKII